MSLFVFVTTCIFFLRTGDPKTFTFTVGLFESENSNEPRTVVTCAQVSSMSRINFIEKNKIAAQLLRECPYICETKKIEEKLREESDNKRVEIPCIEKNKNKQTAFKVFVEKEKENKRIKVTWEKQNTSSEMPRDIPAKLSVLYDKNLTNMQFLPHPYFIAKVIEVHGDYRTNVDFDLNKKSQFTSTHIIRFPVGKRFVSPRVFFVSKSCIFTGHFRSDKEAKDCDTVSKLKNGALFVPTCFAFIAVFYILLLYCAQNQVVKK